VRQCHSANLAQYSFAIPAFQPVFSRSSFASGFGNWFLNRLQRACSYVVYFHESVLLRSPASIAAGFFICFLLLFLYFLVDVGIVVISIRAKGPSYGITNASPTD